ncbi:MAG: hypothetical protein IJC91_04935 [Oscillospiraceae bacterium]|nr:hypothetical protein [Oscillospiraceae bacterium]
MAYQVDPEGLDPQRTAAASTFIVTNNIYDTLLGVTPGSELTNRLAESYELSEDGMSITFNLREGVLFHNGREFKASDVVYTFNRLKGDESPKAGDYANITGIEAVDDYTVKFTTETLDVMLPTLFAYPWSAIVPEEAADDLKMNPVGTGAFKFVEWIPQQSITLVRNDEYWGDAAKLEKINYSLVPDATSLMAGLQIGDFDMIPLAGEQVEILEATPGYKVVSGPQNAVQIMALNITREPLNNVKVRQAISMALNKDEIIDACVWGFGSKIGSHLPTTSAYYVDTNDVMPYDVEAAKALLADAGYPDGFEISLSLPKTYQQHVDAGQVIADQLGKIGIKVNIDIVEWGYWLSDIYGGEHNFDMTVTGHTGRLDPYAFLTRYYSTSGDYISLVTGEIDELLASALDELDETKRRETYDEIQHILAEQLPAIYIQTPDQMVGMVENLQGMEFYPIDVYDLSKLYFE